MTYAHNYTMVKIVSNYMGTHGDYSLLSGPLHLPILLFRMLIPCYLSSRTCLAPTSFTHPQVSIYTSPPLESPPYLYLGGLACPKALTSLMGLTWLLLILSRKTLSSSRIKTVLYLSLYPQCLAHSGYSNILAELGNKILELLFCFLERQSLSSLDKPLSPSERTCYKINKQNNPLLLGFHNVMVMD